MIVSFGAGMDAQKRQWVNDALAATTYPTSRFDATVTFVSSDHLPVADHNAYMCTNGGSGDYTVTIQPWADSESSPDLAQSWKGVDLKHFFMESVIHELMHAIQFELCADSDRLTQLVSCFRKHPATGFAPTIGTLADYHPTGAAWEDRVQEAIAEAGKDIWLPAEYRIYDNRTNWDLIQANL